MNFGWGRSRRLSHAARPELSFERPGATVGVQCLAGPAKGVAGDLRVHPPGGRAVGTRADLHDVLADAAANLTFVMVTGRVRPGDLPRLDRGIPHAQRRAIHVELLVETRGSVLDARHDPHVLNGAPLEGPPEVRFGFDSLRGDVGRPERAHV